MIEVCYLCKYSKPVSLKTVWQHSKPPEHHNVCNDCSQGRDDVFNNVQVTCAKEDGFIYMYRDGEIVRRPKELYGEMIERELKSLVEFYGYKVVSLEEFVRLSAGAPFNEYASRLK